MTIKLKISAYRDETFTTEVGSYSVMLNPESIQWGRTLKYSEKEEVNSSKASPQYKCSAGETLAFDLIIDGTGVVDATNLDVTDNINKIKHLVYDYDGSIHRPFFVKLTWGSDITFKGVLTGLDTNYNLFKADGSPLRAKLSLKFQSYTDPITAAKEEGKTSPDLTHLIDVIEGEHLMQLSQRIYDTPDYYIELAAFNQLDKFRQLIPNSQLIFPPVQQEDERG